MVGAWWGTLYARLTAERSLIAAWVICTVVASIFLGAEFAPTVDTPAHLAMVSVLRELGDGGVLDANFAFGVFPASNSLFYILGLGLSAVFDIATTGVILFAFAITLVCGGLASLLRALGKHPLGAVAALPFVAQWPLIEGFIDFYLGIGLVFLLLAAVLNWIRRQPQPQPRSGPWLIVFGSVLVFLAHVHAMLFFGLALGVIIATSLFMRPSALRLRQALTLVALSLGPMAVLTVIWLAVGDASSATSVGATVEVSPDDRLTSLVRGPLSFAGDHGALLLGVGLLCVILYRVATTLATRSQAADADDASTSWVNRSQVFLLAFLALNLGAVLWMPNNIGGYWSIHVRFVPMTWFIALALMIPAHPESPTQPTPGTTGRLGRLGWSALVAAPLLVAAVMAATSFSKSVTSWNGYTSGLRDVLAAAPESGSLFTVLEPKSVKVETGFRVELWRHIGQYYTAMNLGVTSFSFGWHPGRIVAESPRRERYIERGYLGDFKKMDTHGCFDVILQLGNSDLHAMRKDVHLIRRSGHWATWRVARTCTPALSRR